MLPIITLPPRDLSFLPEDDMSMAVLSCSWMMRLLMSREPLFGSDSQRMAGLALDATIVLDAMSIPPVPFTAPVAPQPLSFPAKVTL